MADGPLIVQSDKTLLLEIDHELADEARAALRAVRGAGARARARPHLPDHPAGALERAGRRSRRRAGRRRAAALLAGIPVPHALLVDVAETMDRYGRLRLDDASGARAGAARARPRRCSRRCCGPRRSQPLLGARVDDDTVVGARRRARQPQAGAAASSAGRPRTWPGTSTARRTRSRCARRAGRCGAYQREAADGFWHGGSGVVVLPCGAGKTHRRCGRDGAGRGNDADPGDQHGRRRGSGRRELLSRTSLTEDEIGEYSRCAQGDPPGHDRDLPGDDHPAEGRVSAPRAVRLRGTGG